jgi:hypothetical protein
MQLLGHSIFFIVDDGAPGDDLIYVPSYGLCVESQKDVNGLCVGIKWLRGDTDREKVVPPSDAGVVIGKTKHVESSTCQGFGEPRAT